MIVPYYCRSGIKLYQGDCREVLPALLAEREGKPYPLILTDPPYTEYTHANAKAGYGGKTAPFVTFSAMDMADLRACFEVLALCSETWTISFMADDHLADLKKTPPLGLRFIRKGIWFKPNTRRHVNGDRPNMGYEEIGMFYRASRNARKKGKCVWHGDAQGRTHAVFTYNFVRSGPHHFGHNPTSKNLSLCRELIRLFSNPGDTVLDPFAGGGTILYAAYLEGRNAVGVEIDERQCQLVVQDLEAAFDRAA